MKDQQAPVLSDKKPDGAAGSSGFFILLLKEHVIGLGLRLGT